MWVQETTELSMSHCSETNTPDVSVVVPLLDEQDNLTAMYEQITQALNTRYSYEILFIDDGSTDNSFELLNRFRGVEFDHT